MRNEMSKVPGWCVAGNALISVPLTIILPGLPDGAPFAQHIVSCVFPQSTPKWIHMHARDAPPPAYALAWAISYQGPGSDSNTPTPHLVNPGAAIALFCASKIAPIFVTSLLDLL